VNETVWQSSIRNYFLRSVQYKLIVVRWHFRLTQQQSRWSDLVTWTGHAWLRANWKVFSATRASTPKTVKQRLEHRDPFDAGTDSRRPVDSSRCAGSEAGSERSRKPCVVWSGMDSGTCSDRRPREEPLGFEARWRTAPRWVSEANGPRCHSFCTPATNRIQTFKALKCGKKSKKR